jgi:hypothetical protein
MSETRLERQYRSAVGWYPPKWRRRFGEAMVGVLLDVADGEKRCTPAFGELADLRRRAVAEWINSAAPEAVRSWVASLSSGAVAAFSLAYFFFVSWPAGFAAESVPGSLPTFGPFLNAAPLFIVPVVLMFLAFVAGSRLAAHLFGVVALLGVVVAAMVRTTSGNWNGPGSTTLAFTLLVIMAANVGGPRRRTPALAAFGVVGGALVAFGLMRLPSGRPWEYQFVGDGGWWTMVLSPWALVGAGAVVLVSVLLLIATHHDVIAAAIAVAWLPWAAAATVTLRLFAGEETDSFVMAVVSVALALLAVHRARSPRGSQRGAGKTPSNA